MPDVSCQRCGNAKPALEEAPLPGRWGGRVQAATCADCWREWVEEQTRIINHERLQPARAEDRLVLYARMRDYLRLPD